MPNNKIIIMHSTYIAHLQRKLNVFTRNIHSQMQTHPAYRLNTFKIIITIKHMRYSIESYPNHSKINNMKYKTYENKLILKTVTSIIEN